MKGDQRDDAVTATSRAWCRALVAPVCALALGQMSGCSSPAGPPSVTCTRATVLSANPHVPASNQVIETFTTPTTGRLTVMVDWPTPETIIRVVLAQSPCGAARFKVNGCNVISDLFPPPKPVEASTTWLGPGTYDLLLSNFSSVGETASVRVDLSSTGCSAP
jgi:hypothetical protein